MISLEITALFGIAAFALTMAQIPLWFIYSGPPPTKNILTRTFIAIFLLPVFVMFMVGMYEGVRASNVEYASVALVSLLVGLAAMILTMVAHSIQVGAIIGKQKRIDPTTMGSGGEGAMLIYGPINHLLMAVFVATGSIALSGAGLVPDWVSLLGYAVSLFQLALVPSLFYKTDPAHFYSFNGWNIPVSGSLMLTWVLVVSINFLV